MFHFPKQLRVNFFSRKKGQTLQMFEVLITYILWTVGIVKIHFADYKTFALEINVMYVVTAMGCKQRFRDKKMRANTNAAHLLK